MPRILLILSALLLIGAAGLGYVNKNKLNETKEAITANETKAAAIQTALDKAKKELTEKTTSLTAETAKATEKDTAFAQLQSQLDAANQAVTEAKAQLTEKAAAFEVTSKELEEWKAKAAATPAVDATAASEPAPEVKELETKVAAIEGEKKVLTDKLTSAEAKVEELSRDVARRKATVMAKGLEGRILAVNAQWGFVVLNLGDRNGVVGNANMIVMRDGERVGKVKITSVEPGRAVADIDSKSLAAGQSIAPNDKVIYTGN